MTVTTDMAAIEVPLSDTMIRQFAAQQPELMMWRCYQSGIFVVGIEPHTRLSGGRL